MKTPTTMVMAQNATVSLAINATAQPIGGPAVIVPRSVAGGTSAVEMRVHGVDIGGLLAASGTWTLRGPGPTVLAVTAIGLAPDQVAIVFTPGTVKGSYSLRVVRGGVRWTLRGVLEIT